MIQIKPIGYIHTGFSQKFGIPRQSGLAASIKGVIEFTEEYRDPDFIKGIEEFDYLWLIWQFSKNVRESHNPTVRPPRLGGEQYKGVFATRSPFRPNNMGLSSVKLESVMLDGVEGFSGPCLIVSGVDMLDGTPIFDIKPYVEYADSHVGVRSGFADSRSDVALVKLGDNLIVPKEAEDILDQVMEILAQDPRAAYDRDVNREFKLAYAGFDFTFLAAENSLTIVDILKIDE